MHRRRRSPPWGLALALVAMALAEALAEALAALALGGALGLAKQQLRVVHKAKAVPVEEKQGIPSMPLRLSMLVVVVVAMLGATMRATALAEKEAPKAFVVTAVPAAAVVATALGRWSNHVSCLSEAEEQVVGVQYYSSKPSCLHRGICFLSCRFTPAACGDFALSLELFVVVSCAPLSQPIAELFVVCGCCCLFLFPGTLLSAY